MSRRAGFLRRPVDAGERRRYVVLDQFDVVQHALGVAAGTLPRQHLYGLDRLVAQSCELLPITESRWRLLRSPRALVPRSRVSHHVDPSQLTQGLVLAARREATLLALNAFVLGTMPIDRALRSRRPPIAAVVHDTFDSDYARGLARMLDGAVCLTERSADALASHGLAGSIVAPWGPDLGFAGYRTPPPETFCVGALGRTSRDHETVVRALVATGTCGIVSPNRPMALPEGIESLDDIAARAGVRFDPLSYDRAVLGFARTSIFAIAIDGPYTGPLGLTEANDALALGRPLVMTRSEGFAFDIEKEGIGIWVDRGDVDGMARAIRTLRDDVAMREEMGARARRFAEERWNNELFSSALDRFLVATGL